MSMRKCLRLAMAAVIASLAMVSTNAVADDEVKAQRVSANGSYEFQPSWGIGLQYGLTFTEMTDYNENLLIPGRQSYFDANFVASHELYGEWSPVEGFRISLFAGYQSLYLSDTGFSYIYGGIEPAWAARRSFYEFAVGVGLGYGYSLVDSSKGDMDGHGLMVRPFVESRFYLNEIFALYLRLAFQYYKEFGLEASDYIKSNDTNGDVNVDEIQFVGPHVALGVRFGSYPEHVKSIGDSDGDGVLDDIDECPDEAGSAEYYGCSNPDKDGDGLCDAWVSEKSLSATFSDVCQSADKCPGDAEDIDGFEDEDGCPDPDNDNDGICDTWVAEQGLSEKYADVCKEVDYCPNVSSNMPGTYGCGNPDPDNDGYCDKWVYDQNLQKAFPQCKGLDYCPNEKGTNEKGCIPKRVEVTEAAIQINDTINFDVNKATIKKTSDSLLEEIAQVFKDNPQIKKVSIEGHTDLSGNAKKNQKLSEDRAKSVMDRLVKLGVEPSRMTSAGFGSSRPIEPLAKGQKKETKEQAAKNRRVEFNIVEQDVVKKTIEVKE